MSIPMDCYRSNENEMQVSYHVMIFFKAVVFCIFCIVLNVSAQPNALPNDPLFPIQKRVKTVVIEKNFRTYDSTAWPLFWDADLEVIGHRIKIGDTVIVRGWAPWAFYITCGEKKGYISWNALHITEELKKWHETVATNSEEQASIRKKKRSAFPAAMAHLSLTASKSEMFVGECVVLTMAFHVADKNRAPLQFYNLGEQLLAEGLIQNDAPWQIDGRIDDIIGVTTRINNEQYTSYPIKRLAYCVSHPGKVEVPAFSLQMLHRPTKKPEDDTVVTFSSKPLAIKVNSLPGEIRSSPKDQHSLTGNFVLRDSIASTASVAQRLRYSITITGEGLLFPLSPPKLSMPNVQAFFMDVIDSDTITDDRLHSSKTFLYNLVFQKPGVYDFTDKIVIPFFDPERKTLRTLHSSAKIVVTGKEMLASRQDLETAGPKNNFIAIDASQSMAVEDYIPNRLEVVKRGLKEFLMSRDSCDIGLILFGGDARRYVQTASDKGYTRRFVDSINFSINKRGTAIGDAIWLAKIRCVRLLRKRN
jgi:hypothetical protein